MFKNRSVKIALVKDENPATTVDAPKINITKTDVKEIMITAGICVIGVVSSVAASSAAEQIAVNRLSK